MIMTVSQVIHDESVEALQSTTLQTMAPAPEQEKSELWPEQPKERGLALRWPDIAGSQDASFGVPQQGPPETLLRQPAELTYNFTVLEEWEGTVLSVENDSFTAQLKSAIPGTPEERASFTLDEVSDSDRDLIRDGAVFYWTVGSRFEFHGQKSLQSTLRFRRLPAWSQREIDRIQEHAHSYDAIFAGRQSATE
jgi:hypothetical protein